MHHLRSNNFLKLYHYYLLSFTNKSSSVFPCLQNRHVFKWVSMSPMKFSWRDLHWILHVFKRVFMSPIKFTCFQMDLHVSTEISMCLIKISISTRISLHNTLTLFSQSQSILHFLNNNVLYFKRNKLIKPSSLLQAH
jgi:hypothetical protein